MKKQIIMISLCVGLYSGTYVSAQHVTDSDAARIATNWIQMIINYKGNWGGAESAYLNSVQEFRFNERTLGYFCDIEPQGYIIVSLRKELSPIKAYSAGDKLDPDSEKGMALLIKEDMSRILDRLEKEFGPHELMRNGDPEPLIKKDYRRIWQSIENYVPSVSQERLEITAAYTPGDTLLDSRWRQGAPYNNDCPELAEPCDNTENGLPVAGCVAIAMAQIMKYWSWPPYGEAGPPYSDPYDWENMRNVVTLNSGEVIQDAVSELIAEIGQAIGMHYGCEGSWAYTSSMVAQFQGNFRFSNCISYSRLADKQAWGNMLKADLNLGRPIYYEVKSDLLSTGHAIVCDGWQEVTGGFLEFHFNYGWGGGSMAWYDLDDLIVVPGEDSNWDHENAVFNIVPTDVALGPGLLGTYSRDPSFPYRYFDQDASGVQATFSAGQFLQTRPDVTITGTGYDTYILFESEASFQTKLCIYKEGFFHDGLMGVHLKGGAMRLSNGGSIRIY